MGIHYQTISFENKSVDGVTDLANDWLTENKGKIQVISSNLATAPSLYIIYILYVL